MDKFELRPPFFNQMTAFLLIVAMIFSLVLGFTVFPKAYDFYLNYPAEPTAFQVMASIIIADIAVWVLFVVSIIASKVRKIVVEKNLVYFMKKSKFGFGQWILDIVIDFSKVVEISERKKSVFTGKVVIVYYWLIFQTVDKGSFEILLNGWDIQNMKNLFFYLRGKYPSIKFNNIVLKDSSEKLSGLTDLSNK